MLPIFVFFVEGINNNGKVGFVIDKVGVRTVNKECFNIMLFDIIGVGLLQRKEVVVGDILFVMAVSIFNISL